MLRVLLVLVAVLVAVLAFVFDQPWLYAGAAVPLVGALVLLGRHFWTASQTVESQSDPADSGEDSLEDLGIMDVRPQDREGGANGTSGSGGASESPATEAASTPADPNQEGEFASEEEWIKEYREELEAAQSAADSAYAGTPQFEDRPVLGPLLESLRAAIGARTVCLLVQEEVALDYQIAALVSEQPDVQRDGSFETQSPLLSATMSRQPVTVRSVDETGRADLHYYETLPEIVQVAVAPLNRSNTSASVFLLADATADADLDTSQSRSLLERYADTVGLVLDVKEAEDQSAPEPSSRPQPAAADRSAPPRGAAAEETVSSTPADVSEETAPRPRREIIAEEMEAADETEEPMALVLVLLNRYEAIARNGSAAVDRAEQHFRARLEDLAPGERIERFGELNYGVFLRRDVEAVEAWALDLQDAMARETGELEGGVSVGIAMRGQHHTPEDLRADATEALLEAYETGECAIKA